MSMLADDHVFVARLRAVHDLLVKHGPDHFNMGAWITIDWDANSVANDMWNDLVHSHLGDLEWLVSESPDRVLTPCGTTACLAGFAALAADDVHLHESHEIAEWLGMGVDCPRLGMFVNWTNTDWFFIGRWPGFARDSYRRKLDRGLTDQLAQHQVVVDMLSDLIAGRRANWWDAGEQDAQSA